MNLDQSEERRTLRSFSVSEAGVVLSAKELTAPGERIAYVDSTRGLLIVMMILVHAALPCVPEVRDSIQHMWALGIATAGFTMLAGYTVGVRYGMGLLSEPSRVYRRTLELLVVMFYSNLVITLVKLYVDSRLHSTVTLSWIIGLFTFQTPYNISGVLLPIALQLPLSYLICKAEYKLGRIVYGPLLAFTIVLIFLGYQFRPTSPFLMGIMNVLMWNGAGGFPLIPFIGYGILGLTTGRLLAEYIVKENYSGKIPYGFIAVAASLLLMWGASNDLIGDHGFGTWLGVLYSYQKSEFWRLAIYPYLKSELIFLLVLCLGGFIAQRSYHLPFAHVLSVLGRYALFAFVIHRVISQVLIFLFDMKDGGYSTAVYQFVLLCGLTFTACLLRLQFDYVDRFCKKVYL